RRELKPAPVQSSDSNSMGMSTVGSPLRSEVSILAACYHRLPVKCQRLRLIHVKREPSMPGQCHHGKHSDGRAKDQPRGRGQMPDSKTQGPQRIAVNRARSPVRMALIERLKLASEDMDEDLERLSHQPVFGE